MVTFKFFYFHLLLLILCNVSSIIISKVFSLASSWNWLFSFVVISLYSLSNLNTLPILLYFESYSSICNNNHITFFTSSYSFVQYLTVCMFTLIFVWVHCPHKLLWLCVAFPTLHLLWFLCYVVHL